MTLFHAVLGIAIAAVAGGVASFVLYKREIEAGKGVLAKIKGKL